MPYHAILDNLQQSILISPQKLRQFPHKTIPPPNPNTTQPQKMPHGAKKFPHFHARHLTPCTRSKYLGVGMDLGVEGEG